MSFIRKSPLQVRRLRAFYAQLNQPGGVKASGGLRKSINTLKGHGYKPGKTAWLQGVQRVDKDEYMNVIEPRYQSSFLIDRKTFHKDSVSSGIQAMRKRYRRANKQYSMTRLKRIQ